MDTIGDPKGYYQRLGIGRKATPDELRAAFRAKAKLYHPDQGGATTDTDRLREVVEAWDVLSDPARRAAYDAEQSSGRPGRRAGRGFAQRRRSTSGGRSRLAVGFPPLMRLISAVVILGILAIGMSTLWWVTSRQLAARDDQLDELARRLADTLSGRAEERAKLRSDRLAGLEGVVEVDPEGVALLLGAEIPFSPGTSQLDPYGSHRLDQASSALAETVRAIPPDWDWFVLVESMAGPSVGLDGVPVDAWGRTVLRIATVLDRLASQGMPSERLVTRFVAGPARTAGESGTVSLRLLCCREPRPPPG